MVSIRNFKTAKPEIGDRVFIDDSAQLIGAVNLGDDVSVWPNTVIRGDVQSITIGPGTNVQDGCVLHVSHDSHYSPGGFALTIGQGVTIGHKAVVHGCMVGDFCLIGIGAIIMDGAVLGDYCMLAAGALVPPGKNLPGGYLYVGSPAKPKRELSDDEKQFLHYSYQHYIKLKNEYLDSNLLD